MSTKKNEIEVFDQKLTAFAENELTDNEREMLKSILSIHEIALDNANATEAIFGDDEGFLEEIKSAKAASGEIKTMTIVSVTAKSSRACLDTAKKIIKETVKFTTGYVVSKVGMCPENPKPKEPKQPKEPKKPQRPITEGPGDHVIP